jgi:hypothetical protein
MENARIIKVGSMKVIAITTMHIDVIDVAK